METAFRASEVDRGQQVAALRAAVAKMSPHTASLRSAIAPRQPGTGQLGAGEPSAGRSGALQPDHAVRDKLSDPLSQGLALPESLAELVPTGGLARGQVAAVSGARSLLVALLASATAQGARVAVCGCADLGLAAIAEQGGALSRLAIISVPSNDRGEVAALLLDGMDLVVLDLSVSGVSPARASAIAARARARSAVLVVTGGSWPGVDVYLDAVVEGSAGLDRGYGRINQIRLRVRSKGRAFSPRQMVWNVGSVASFSASMQHMPEPDCRRAG